MRVTPDSLRAFDVDVYLNGKKQKDCVQADEEAGVCWLIYRGADGRVVHEFDAEPGSLFYEHAQVIKVKGSVEIKVTPRPGESAEDIRRIIHETAGAIRVYFYANDSEPLK